MDNWAAAYVDGEHVTVWELQAEQVLACKDVTVTAFTDYAAKIQGPIIACGLPGPSRIVPCTPFETVGATSISSNIAAVPALAQHNPPAISSGLETVITGYLSVNPGFEGVICVHGAATLWAQISAGEVVSFQTFLTPELITALAGAQHPTDGFCDAVSDTLSHPDRLARQLSSARTMNAPDRVTGHLVGAELAAAKPYWLGQQIVMIGNLTDLYTKALQMQGVEVAVAPWEDMILNGLKVAYAVVAAVPDRPAN